MKDIRPGDLVHVMYNGSGSTRLWATPSYVNCMDIVIVDVTGMVGLVLARWTDQEEYSDEVYMLIGGLLGWMCYVDLLEPVSR